MKQISYVRSSHPEVFCDKDVLENSTNSHENICARVSFFNNVGSPDTRKKLFYSSTRKILPFFIM